MDPRTITLRPGLPTIEEGLACARLLDTAAEGFFGILLGRRARRILAHAYLRTGNEYSHENVLFAERGGRVVGMALGFTAEERRSFPANPLRKLEGYPKLRAGCVRFLARSMFRILETVADGDFYLLSLAVDRDQRGQGIGSALIEAMESRARTAEAKRFSLDVAAKNHGGQKLYERHGLRIHSRWPKHLNLGRLGLVRMSKEL